MGLSWYLQLLTYPLDQGLWSANIADSQMLAVWKLLPWKALGAPLTVRMFWFELEGLSRKKKKKPAGAELFTPTSVLIKESLGIEGHNCHG